MKTGDQQAAAALWERYFERLVRYARRKLEDEPRRVADEEDVALTAFSEFCRAAEQGRFPNLADRDGLWRLLLCITGRRAADLKRRNAQERRWLRGESVLPNWDNETGVRALAEVVGDSPSRVDEELVRLGRRYGLLSRATSYVAIEERPEGERATEAAELRQIPVSLTRGWGGLQQVGLQDCLFGSILSRKERTSSSIRRQRRLRQRSPGWS